MLNILRKQAQSTVIQGLVLIIAIVFIFWGVGTNLGSKRNALATVNGHEIPFEDYQRMYDTAIDNLRVQFGGNVPQGLLDSLGLKQQVLSQLVQAEILRQGGREMGITVSRTETQDKIKDMEVFQQSGLFDLNRYKQVLSQNRMTPTSFEASLKNDLLTSRVSGAIEKFAILPESEIQFRRDFANTQVRLAYAVFKSEDFAGKVQVEEEKLAAWYGEKKDNYMPEPQIQLKYIYFGFDDDLDKVALTDEELKAGYERDMAKYTVPEQRHARHILFKVSEEDDAQARTDKKKKADDVLQMAREGNDFAELAKEYSEGPTAKSGGDLGFFNRGAMVEQFDNAVFNMQPGDISDVVETVFGFHIIKLEAVRPEVVRPFEDVKESIAAEMKKGAVQTLTRERARKAYEKIILSGSLDKYSSEANGQVMESGYFSRKSPPEAPLSDPRFLQVAFQLKKGELSSLVQGDDGYAILFVDDIKTPEAPELDGVRERVTADYIKAESVELAKEAADNALKAARESKALTAENLSGEELQQSAFIKRTNPTDAGGLPVQVVQQAFELTLKEPLPQEPFSQGESFYVYQLLEKQLADEPLDETQRQVLSEQLAQAVQSRLLSDWISWRQSNAKIWTNEQILQ